MSLGIPMKYTKKLISCKIQGYRYIYLYLGVGINVFSLDTSRKCTPYNQKKYITRECTMNIGNYQPPKVVRFFIKIVECI